MPVAASLYRMSLQGECSLHALVCMALLGSSALDCCTTSVQVSHAMSECDLLAQSAISRLPCTSVCIHEPRIPSHSSTRALTMLHLDLNMQHKSSWSPVGNMPSGKAATWRPPPPPPPPPPPSLTPIPPSFHTSQVPPPFPRPTHLQAYTRAYAHTHKSNHAHSFHVHPARWAMALQELDAAGGLPVFMTQLLDLPSGRACRAC